MREVKFRAWNTATRSMYPVEHFALRADGTWLQLIDDLDNGDQAFARSQGDMVFMAHTGLKDKHGVDIYEGDLVRLDPKPDGTNGVEAAAIEYMPEAMMYAAKLGDDFVPFAGQNLLDDSKGYQWRAWLRENDCQCHMVEVLGNIYANPELLKATS